MLEERRSQARSFFFFNLSVYCSEYRFEIRLHRFHGLRIEGGARGTSQLSAFPVFVDLLSRTVDRVFLGIQQLSHEHDQLDFPSLINSVARPVLRRMQKSKLTLPVPQN